MDFKDNADKNGPIAGNYINYQIPELENLNRLITSKNIKLVIEILPT
jgi:hypothetical protein